MKDRNPPAAPTDPRSQLVDHLGALRAYAISLTRNMATADDLVQDTIVKAWTNIDRFIPGSNLQAWLFTILRNTYFSVLRKRRLEVSDPDNQHALRLSVGPVHDDRLAMRDFRRAFDGLSDEHREVLILLGASGLSCEEVAAMLGVAVGTVKSRASRARRRLAALMGLAEGESVMDSKDRATLAVITRPGGEAA